ncbi:MAG: FkbM family methyltransferase [Synechococcales bacterium]|nr:FkbM family methyltransferase [Synechococcales bacterium]
MLLKSLGLSELGGGINLVDIGSSGSLDRYWAALFPWLNVYAFDPNEAECQRLAGLSHPFASATYLPYAIAGSTGTFLLYQTRDPFCWSLLEPDQARWSRFGLGDRFQVDAITQIQAMPLNAVPQINAIDVDVVKSDTQGLELPILSNALQQVNQAFVIEVETGFTQNYKQETTFWQISQFLEEQGFRLFDINPHHRVARKNQFQQRTRYPEILWCESLWLKDYLLLAHQGSFNLSREKAWKVLLLCANHGCIDYGFELATLFAHHQLLSQGELQQLEHPSAWRLPLQNGLGVRFKRFLQAGLNWVPNRYLRQTAQVLLEATHTEHPLKQWFNRM